MVIVKKLSDVTVDRRWSYQYYKMSLITEWNFFLEIYDFFQDILIAEIIFRSYDKLFKYIFFFFV